LADRVFRNFNKNKAAAMLRKDLEKAGIEHQDQSGQYADFHALRHSFITSVGKAGATVKEHQRLARHSKPELTLGVYTHLSISDERRALEKIPQIIEPDKRRDLAAALKTGTDDRPLGIAEGELTPKLTPKSTPAAYSHSNKLEAKQTDWQRDASSDKSLIEGELDTENDRLAQVGIDRRRSDSNRRITVLQTVALGLLATPPRLISRQSLDQARRFCKRKLGSVNLF